MSVREPAPIPKSRRPPDTMSVVAAILASSAGGQGGQQGPAFEDRATGVAADRQQVIERPGVPDLRDRVGFLPDRQQVVVADLLGRGGDPEARPGGRCQLIHLLCQNPRHKRKAKRPPPTNRERRPAPKPPALRRPPQRAGPAGGG